MSAADCALAGRLGVNPGLVSKIRRGLQEGVYWRHLPCGRVVFMEAGVRAVYRLLRIPAPEKEGARGAIAFIYVASVGVPDGALMHQVLHCLAVGANDNRGSFTL